jgi:Ribbon-helix-helix protein, copG family
MKRTTLALDDDLLRRLKADAAERGVTLAALVNELLRQGTAARAHRRDFRLKLQGWQAELQPGVDILDRDQLFDLTTGR